MTQPFFPRYIECWRSRKLGAVVVAGCVLLACAGHVASVASAQNLAPADADLERRSASLGDTERAKSRQLFSTGFTLWQGGDFAAAELAFRQGLDIDPANPQANFYLGDILQKLRKRKEAADFLGRAAALGKGTPEGFKAQAALQALTKPVPIAELSLEEVKDMYVGRWGAPDSDDGIATISKNEKGELVISGTRNCFLCGNAQYVNLELLPDGSIRYGQTVSNAVYRFKLVSPTRMDGSYDVPVSRIFNEPAFAVRR